MLKLIVLAALSAAATMTQAHAQSITGDWVDYSGEVVNVRETGSRYRGAYTTGPDTGKTVLAVAPAGNGTFTGQHTTYRGAKQTQDVTALLQSGQLILQSCFRTPDVSGCIGVDKWRRTVMNYRKLDPNVSDIIRRPKPPPVIRKIPGINLKGSPG